MSGSCSSCGTTCDCYTYLVYGILECDPNIVLNHEWLCETYYDVLTLSYQSNCEMNGNAVYGYGIDLCQKTGRFYDNVYEKFLEDYNPYKELIQKLHGEISAYCEENGYKKPKIGYFLGISHSHKGKESYIPDTCGTDEDDDEDEDEKCESCRNCVKCNRR